VATLEAEKAVRNPREILNQAMNGKHGGADQIPDIA
jgi:hypothetical protein